MVHLLVKNVDFFLTKKIGTENVETGTLLSELHTSLGAEMLQRDILRDYKKTTQYPKRIQVVS